MGFPLVSAGVYGWPIDDAARTAVEALVATPTDVSQVHMVAFNDSAYVALCAAVDG